MRRIGFRLSVRTLVELVGLAGIGLAFWRLAEEARPPGPAVRALRAGVEADRIAALRTIGLMGESGVGAIPALVLAARDDPSPVVRRGAVHALTRIAADESGLTLPVDEALSGPPQKGTRGPTGPRPGSTLPLLRPRADESALAMAEVMRLDPDPSVRIYALRALRKILDMAIREREIARSSRTRKPGEPVPRHLGSGRWVESVARSIAERAGDPDPEVAGHAIGFLAASKGKEVLPAEERIASLLAAVEADGRPLPLAIDVLALNVAALLAGPDHSEAPRLRSLLVDRLDDPPPIGTGAEGSNGPARDSGQPFAGAMMRRFSADEGAETGRAAYASILWGLVGSADELRRHPEAAEALVSVLSGDQQAFPWVESLYGLNQRFTADILRRGGATWFGGLMALSHPMVSALKATGRDPAILGLVWPRVDREGRRSWLSEESHHMELRGPGSWDALMPLLSSPDVRPELAAEEAESVLGRLLDEPEPGPDDSDARTLRRLVQEVERRRGGMESTEYETTPIEEAREIRRLRELAVLTYFARGSAPGSEAVGRLVDHLRGLLGSEAPGTRQWAAWLLGSLGPAADPAVAELEAMADGEPDEAARRAAGAALESIRGGGDPEGTQP